MMNNNHKNSTCAYGETLVEYLYGEASGTRKSEFEKHLNNCEACADELAAFSGVHFAIDDWKAKEFAPLAAPLIEIPYERKIEVSKGSWLSAFVRDLFSLSPRAWTLTTATAAVLVVCVGIALFALNAGKNDELTQTNKNTKPAVVPSSEKTQSANDNQNKQQNKDVSPNEAPRQPQPDVAVSDDQNQKNNRAVKVSNNPRPAQKTDNVQKNNAAKRNDKNRTAPKMLPDEDDEDDSLRLAELFEEIDAE